MAYQSVVSVAEQGPSFTYSISCSSHFGYCNWCDKDFWSWSGEGTSEWQHHGVDGGDGEPSSSSIIGEFGV